MPPRCGMRKKTDHPIAVPRADPPGARWFFFDSNWADSAARSLAVISHAHIAYNGHRSTVLCWNYILSAVPVSGT